MGRDAQQGIRIPAALRDKLFGKTPVCVVHSGNATRETHQDVDSFVTHHQVGGFIMPESRETSTVSHAKVWVGSCTIVWAGCRQRRSLETLLFVC